MTNRILFVKSTSSPVGGVPTWLDRASQYLGECGYDPVVALVRGGRHNVPERYLEYHPDLNSIEVDGRGLDREGRVRACIRAIRHTRPKLVIPLGVLDANDAAMRAKSSFKELFLIGRAQGNLPPMLADLRDYRDGIDHVVCVGALTRRFLINHAGFSHDRVTHIPNGSDLATTARVTRQTNSPLRLGYVGRLSRADKRVMDIPALCEELVKRGLRFHLTIAGSGPCEAELRERLAGFGEQVAMTGAKPLSVLYAEVFPHLDALMLFSESETFGIVLAEAMMNGVVPITSRYLGFQSEKLVVDGTHGLSFDVGDMQSAADAIARLDESPGLLATLSQNGIDHATTNYTWKRCLERWDDVLQAVIARKPLTLPRGTLEVNHTASGRLDHIGVPAVVVDVLRRARRLLLGPGVDAGGEEWPLFRRSHTRDRLDQIERDCKELEVTAKVSQFPIAT